MMNTNIAKLIVAVVTIVCVTVLLAVGAIGETAGVATITSVLGYMLGNGVAALTGKPVQPIFERKPDEQQQ